MADRIKLPLENLVKELDRFILEEGIWKGVRIIYDKDSNCSAVKEVLEEKKIPYLLDNEQENKYLKDYYCINLTEIEFYSKEASIIQK